MKRDSYIFYRNWWDAFRNMPDDFRLQAYDGIMQYAFDNNLEGVSAIAKGFIDMARPIIDKDRNNYEAICERNKRNGLKGGRPKNPEKPRENPDNPVGFMGFVSETQNNPDITQRNPQKPHNDNDNNNDNDIIEEKNINTKKESRFIPPTIEEVAEYAAEKGYIYVDAEKFCNFYDSKGWYVGKNKMKKWRSAVSNWNKTEKERTQRYGTTNNGLANANNKPTHAELFKEAAERLLREMPLENDGKDEERGRGVQESLPFD